MSQLFTTWQSNLEREERCSELMGLYDLYDRELFTDYEPLATASHAGTHQDFFRRFGLWVENFQTDETQWAAFNSLDHLFFVGRLEMTELYRIAYETTVATWLIEQANISLSPSQFEAALSAAREVTWVCPITDSLRINAFRHINHLVKPDYFPDWRSLERFGDPEKLRDYVQESGVQFLVLIEDFVGAGTQVTPAIQLAANELQIPVLVIALVTANEGDLCLKGLVAPHAHMSYEPLIVLPPSATVTRLNVPDESAHQGLMRQLVKDYAAKTRDRSPYGRNPDHGYFVVTYANCPNNSIRLIHADNARWRPLFPRSGRRQM